MLSGCTGVTAGGCNRNAFAIQPSSFASAFVIVSGLPVSTSLIPGPPIDDGVNPLISTLQNAGAIVLTNPTVGSL